MIFPKQEWPKWFTEAQPSSCFCSTMCWNIHDSWESSAILGCLWLLGRSCSVTQNPKSPQILCAMRKAHLSQNTAWYFEQLHQGFWSSIKEGKSYHITSAAAANTEILYSSLSFLSFKNIFLIWISGQLPINFTHTHTSQGLTTDSKDLHNHKQRTLFCVTNIFSPEFNA